MADFSEKVRVWIRWTIIRAQRYPLLKELFLWGCRLGTWRIGQILTKMPGVEAVYICHTHPNSPSFVPGHSDLDVTIVLTKDAEGNPDRIEAVKRKVESRSLICYYLNPRDARFTSHEELARVMRTYDSPYEPLRTPNNWVLLAGKEVRTEQPRDFPTRKLPWHPEFNRMWQHILQDYLRIRMPGLEDQYLRVFYRSAIKQQLYFQTALGKQVAGRLYHLDDSDDSLVEEAFREDPEMQVLFSDLKRRDFWDKDARHVKERIFLHVLQSAAEFFRTYSFHPKINPSVPPFQEDNEHHWKAYNALESRLGQYPVLTSMLKGVLSYPIPHCHPYFYQVDLMIPDGISFEQFRKIVRTVDEAFKAREFHLDDCGYSVALVLESIYSWPLVFLGFPFPFLNGHIRRYGKCLIGTVPKALEGTLCPEDLVEWCRIFLPYYMLSMSRRIEYSSRTLNYCQVASIRLFLETGETETDPLVLRERHRERFKVESPVDHVWTYMMKDKPGRQNNSAYKEATLLLSRECKRVEALLADYN